MPACRSFLALSGLVLGWAQTLIANPVWEAPLRADLSLMASNLTATLVPWTVPSQTFYPETYGAVADGVTVNTASIQQAIDACSAAGGGVVAFTNGSYVSGTFRLKSGVMIEVAANARILGSTNLADYPEIIEQLPSVMRDNHLFRLSLIYAERVSRIGIRGTGMIDFRGTTTNFPGTQTTGPIVGRPFGIRVIECSDIVLQDITLKDAAAWMQNYLACTNLIFERIKVENQANHNNDGLDIDGCKRVIVRNCLINSEDDAMCLKGASLMPTEDVLIEDSTFVTTCNALKIGTDTQGDFRRILARRLALGGIPVPLRTWKGREASTGITLATVDGGIVEDIFIHDVAITNSRCPIFLRLGDRGRVPPGYPDPPVGAIHRILIEDVTGSNNRRQGNFISGLGNPRTYIEDVSIRRMNLDMIGGGTEAMITASVNDGAGTYPDAHQFSVNGLPAFGFYVRSARRVTLEQITITPTAPDARPFLTTETADATLDNPSGHDLHAQVAASTLTVAANAPVFAGDLLGTGTFIKAGSSSLAFTEPLTFTGAIQVQEGTLDFSAGQKPGAFTPGVPAPTLNHRWSFNGNMTDSVGGSTATVINVGPNNTTLTSSNIILTGGAIAQSDYVELGQSLIGGDTNALTVELWATPLSLQNWARIFDFGSGGGTGDYILMSWNRGTLATDGVRWRENGSDALTVNESCQPYNLNTEYHIAMTMQPLNASQTQVTWYRAPGPDSTIGAARGQNTVSLSPAQLNDLQDTLGRSLYGNPTDNTANAAYNEVRLWTGALSSNQLAQTHLAGPNSLPALTGTPGFTNQTPALSWLAIAPGASVAMTNGAMQFQTVTNNGTLRLIGNAQFAVPGSLVNQGVLDVINWNGPVPAAWTNSGNLLDRSSVRIIDCKQLGTNLQITVPGYAGHHFQLQQARTANQTSLWDDIGIPSPGAGTNILFTVPVGVSNAFYRVWITP